MLSPQLPGMDALQLLLAVDRAGSLRAAAAEVGVSQQAVWARIRSIESQVGVPVLSAAADVGFVEGPGIPRGLRSRVVARDRLAVVVPPTHRWARRRSPVAPAELAATALVSRESGSGTRKALAQALAAYLPPG